MYKICRLVFSAGGRQAHMATIIEEAMQAAGVAWDDISTEAGGVKTHFGNWVLVPILDNEAAHRLAQALQAMGCRGELDMRRFVLEQGDIDVLRKGDKVRIQFTNALAGQSQAKGTVVGFEQVFAGYGPDGPRYAKAVVVRRYRSTMCWRFKAGDEVGIWKGWSPRE